MDFHIWFKRYGVYATVVLIGLLLIGNIYLIYENNKRIEYHKNVYENAENIRVNTLEIIRNLHLLDMALRSYALVKSNETFLRIADSCAERRPEIFANLQRSLAAQHFPMQDFYPMRDSMAAYMVVIGIMRDHLVHDRKDEFIKILTVDPGRRAFLAYQPFSQKVDAFEGNISRNAQLAYGRALRNSYVLQIVLFFIAMPTLAYTAFFTSRSLLLSEKLQESNERNYRMVAEQNTVLEMTVAERTKEIAAQNEEILGQNEEIAAHNEQLLMQREEIEKQRNTLKQQNEELQEAKKIIEKQNAQIQVRHDLLAEEVDKQTQHLKKTNLELVEQNSRLEQFAYIISHNLRAPMARLIGLASILQYSKNQAEAESIVKMMVKSTSELDHVIKDLGFILGIQNPVSMIITEVDLNEMIDRTLTMLESEIKETSARIVKNLDSLTTIRSLQPYVESIFYNLISNAIKYRHPDRPPEVKISAYENEEFIEVKIEDNGIGIDLEKNRDNLFSLYKRFHFHVEGKGLGLYLVKTQMNMLGGDVDVESTEGEGTMFSLFFKRRYTSTQPHQH